MARLNASSYATVAGDLSRTEDGRYLAGKPYRAGMVAPASGNQPQDVVDRHTEGKQRIYVGGRRR